MKHSISGLIKKSIVIAITATLISCGGADERKEKYLEKGKAYLEEKNYDKARIEIKNVLQIDPKYAEAYYLMGQLEEDKKELGKALGNYRKAIDIKPDYTEAKIKLAKIYVIAGTEDFNEKAKELLAEVNKEQPNNSEAKLTSAVLEYRTGSKSQATKSIENIVNEDMTLIDGIHLLSSIYIESKEFEKAKSLLLKAIESNPNNLTLKTSIAGLYANNLNDLERAEKYLHEALKLEPENYSIQVTLASFYGRVNKNDMAESILRKTIQQNDEDIQRYIVLIDFLSSKVSVIKAETELKKAINNKPDLYDLRFVLVKLYRGINKRDEAKSVLEEIVNEKSYELEGVEARILLAEYLLEEGDKAKSRAYVDEVISEYPNNDDALIIASKIAISDFDMITAINGLRTVVKNNPKNAEAFQLLARAHALNGENSLAENELRKAIEANPVNQNTHINYATYLVTTGNVDEAISVVDKALMYFKDSYELLNLKLKILAMQGKEPEVVALMDYIEQVEPGNAEINLNKGKYYLSKREISKAVEQFEKAYTKSNDKYMPLEMITKAYVVDKQYNKALDRLQKRLDENPDDVISNLLMGQVYIVQNNFKGAEAKFIKALNSSKTWFIPYANLASLYLKENEIDKALAVYVDAESNLKNKVPAQLKIASIYESKKDYSSAMDAYRRILASSPFNKLAINNYASLLLDSGNEADIPKALELLRDFENNQQPAFMDTLGWAYAKSGNYVKAIELLKKVVDKSSTVAVFRYHLGYALYNHGDKAAAKSHLEIAVSSEQSFVGKENAVTLLKSI